MSLARNTALTGFGGMIAVGSGVVLDGMLVAIFGLGAETDAFFIASLVPLAVITMLYLQAEKVIQPQLIHVLTSQSRAAAWHFLNAVMTIVGALALVAGLLCIPLAPLLLRVQAPGVNHATRALAATLCSVFFLVPALYVPIALMKESLKACDDFTVPALLKPVENVSKISAVLLSVRHIGILSVVVGVVFGAVAQVALLYVFLRRHGFSYRPVFSWRDPNIRQAFRSGGFPLIGHLSGAATDVVQNALGSLAGEGAVSALRLATRIIDSFAGVLANSVIVALTPVVTHSFVRQGADQMKRRMQDGMRLLLLLAVPASAWLWLMAKPMIALLFQRMRFSAADTELVSSLLLLMIPYILLSRVFGIAELGFYAGCDTRTPVAAAIALCATYVVLMVAMVSPWGIHGLAVARSVSYLVGAALMVYLLRRKFGPLDVKALGTHTLYTATATLVMTVCILGGGVVARQLPLSGVASNLVQVSLPSALGLLGLYLSTLHLGILPVDSREAAVRQSA